MELLEKYNEDSFDGCKGHTKKTANKGRKKSRKKSLNNNTEDRCHPRTIGRVNDIDSTMTCGIDAWSPRSPLVHDSNDIIHLVLQRAMVNEDRKRALRESITNLKQIQEKEEDEELRVLMAEEEALCSRLNAGTNAGSGKQSKAKIAHKSQCEKPGMGSTEVSKDNESVNLIKDMTASLQNLTGVKFDMSGFLNEGVKGKHADVKNVTHFVEDTGSVKGKRYKRQKQERDDDSESETEGDCTTSDEEDQVQTVRRKNPRKGSVKSGRHDRPSDTKLVSNEWYAHTTLDEAMGGEKEFNDLSFNLLVAGELEIITSHYISNKEMFSRLELLKQLSYKHEIMSISDISVTLIEFFTR